MKKAPKAPELVAALRRSHANTLRAEMRSGVVRRGATFQDKKRVQDKRACRGRVAHDG